MQHHRYQIDILCEFHPVKYPDRYMRVRVGIPVKPLLGLHYSTIDITYAIF